MVSYGHNIHLKQKVHMMTADEQKLVLDSLALVQPISDRIAKSFYLHLFEIAPQTRKLFTGDMDRQGTMLMTSLSLAVNKLGEMESARPSVQALGERHYSYGVKLEHYPLAIESFLWALEQHLGEYFTPAHRDAWRAAFQSLADEMLKAYESQ